MKKPKNIIVLFVLLTLVLSSCAQPDTEEISHTPSSVEDLPGLPAITPSLTPESTSTPAELVDEGDYAIFAGDYDAAIQVFTSSLNSSADPDVVSRSNLGIGQAYYEQEDFSSALGHLRLATDSDNAIIAARANYLLGKTYTRLERLDEALAAYETYLLLRPGLLDSHVQELRGDLFNTLGDYAQAIASFQEAYRTHPEGGDEALSVKIAIAYENSGDSDTALALYQDIYHTSGSDYTKAEMDLRMGWIYQALDQPEQAYTYFQDAVDNFPYTFDAHTALATLVNAGVPVNEYQRGFINFNQRYYNLALEAFNRYLAEEPEELLDHTLYYKGLALQGVSTAEEPRYEEAIAVWWDLIDTYPTSTFFVSAWENIENAQWVYLGEHEQAAETALTYVARYPELAESANFLFRAGRNYERAGLLQEAADTWQRIANEYPGSEETFRATYFAGIALVRLGDWEGAQPVFARALVLTSQPSETAAAYLWIGKCQEALGDISAAVDSWKQAHTADPFGYYSIRAEDLLIGREPFAQPDSFELDPDLTPYRLDAESWLRITFEIPADTNLESPGLLANDPRFQRGLEYWSLGLYRTAKAEFESMRVEYEGDPAQTFRLIPALVEIGLYRSALLASTNLLRSAGLQGADALEAPEFFSRIRFGAYYLDWLIPIAEGREFSPLLLLALMRQESTFEGFISSGAGARGLMQIIPATGAQLATDLNWPENYSAEDLDRPYVSLFLGTTYLARQRQLFEGDLYAMLAAYNGGPGSTLIWRGLLDNQDPDLFLETIRFQETRNYIRLITENFYIYRWLYGSPMEP
jgi:soluble lytic murein transglycosylase